MGLENLLAQTNGTFFKLEEIEVLFLRKFEAAHKAGDEHKVHRLTIALEELRELGGL